MANDILESIGEFVYRPYDTEWAKLDPAAELGDGVTINGVFSGIYVNETNFSNADGGAYLRTTGERC